MLAQDLLNPLSRLVLEGSVLGGDTVKVRTLSEAERLQNDDTNLSWLGSMDDNSNNKSVVILRNHDSSLHSSALHSHEKLLA